MPLREAASEWKNRLSQLTFPPEALTRKQRNWFWILTLLVGLTRLFAVARSVWDTDEVLFSLSVVEFNVPGHRPHPPGFPLFVAMGKLIAAAGVEPFRSLQSVSVFFAMLLFPLTFLLARELRFSYAGCVAAASFLCFLPNVWIFGGTAFSDITSLTLLVGGLALLLRGYRSSRAFFAGCLLAGCSAAVRSQNLAVAFLPFVLACAGRFRRRWWIPLVGALIIGVVVAGAYGGAIAASSSVEDYKTAIAHHSDYISRVDSFRNPNRPHLLALSDDFFFRQYRSQAVSIVFTVLVLISLLTFIPRRQFGVLLTLLAFGPFAILAWMLLDHLSVGRFSIGYLPLFTLLAADGLEACASFMFSWRRLERNRTILSATGIIVAYLLYWTAPALWTVATTFAPPEAAIRWIKANVDPKMATIYVASGVLPFAERSLGEYRMAQVEDDRGIPLSASRENAWIIAEGISSESTAVNFSRPRRRLWRIVRHRFFEVSVIPLRNVAQFGEGWYEGENQGIEVWRWMGSRSLTVLPALPVEGQLSLVMTAPLDTLRAVPTVTITLDGVHLDRFRFDNFRMERTYKVLPLRDGGRRLVIETSETVNPKKENLNDDSRDLGLVLRTLSWGASPVAR